MTEITEREIVLDIEGMTCASCVGKVRSALSHVDHVSDASVNLVTRTATVHSSADDVDPLIHAVHGAGYGAAVHQHSSSPAEEVRGYGLHLIVAVVFTIPVLWLAFAMTERSWSMDLASAFATPVVFYAGWPFHRSAFRSALHGATTMDTLISIGAFAAYGYSAWAVLAGEPDAYFDTAAVIVTLILLGKVLEARARMTAGDASRALLERGAKEATLLEDGRERRVPIDDLLPGSLVVVRAGEKVPADGVVREGTSWMDLSLLTGESVPVDVGPGDEVVGAAINGTGRLVVFVSAVGSETRLADIVRSLERAQGSQAPVQRLADRISSVFVPIVLLVAALTLLGWVVADRSEPGTAVLHAVAVLIIACPCALGLATPAAVMTGTGRAAELGALFKDGRVLEVAHDLDVVLLDKTGTVTEGSMSVVDVRPLDGLGADDVLSLAAAAESGSEHPIARAVLAAARERGVEVPPARDHAVLPGAGAVAVLDGSRIRVGRPDEDEGVDSEIERLGSAGATAFGVWRDDALVGLVSVSDTLKADAAASIRPLHELGLEVQLVSGDRRSAAEAVAAALGVDRVVAEVLPQDKAAWVERLRSQGRRVAFVGDGINDAPALAAADVGMAMGTGTDVALAAADVQLMGGRLSLVPDALELSRRTFRIIRENLFWAFAYNVVMIPLAVFGVLTPMWAAAAMAASSVSVVVNALRLRRYRVS